MHQAVLVLMLGTLLAAVPGCMERIALFPRPTLPEGQPDLIGSVEQLDLAAHRLYLRSESGERRAIAFSRDAQVLSRGREYPVSRLKPGDVVAMQIRHDASGESYVDLIRIQQNSVSNPGIREDTIASSAIETLAGTVQSVNRRDDSFELNNRPHEVVSVDLSRHVRDSDRERFRTLRSGDHVRIEGKFVGNDRFEMLSFLNDEQ